MPAKFTDPDLRSYAIRTTDALRESEARFRSTFENAAVGMAHVSPEGRWLRVNGKVAEIVGYTPGELQKLTFQQVTHPEDLDLDLDLLGQMVSGTRDTYNMEKRYIRKDGEVVWVNLTVGCVRSGSGEIDYFISVIEDITGRKRMHDALIESEARFRAIQQTSPDGFLVYRSVRDTYHKIIDFVCDYANPAAVVILTQYGVSGLGHRLSEFAGENGEAPQFHDYVGVVETGETFLREARFDMAGDEAWWRSTAAKVGDGFAVTYANITQERISEKKLRESDTHLRSILNNVVAFVGLLDPDGILLEANDVAFNVAGTTRDAVIGKPLWDTIWWNYDPVVQARMKAAIAEAASGKLTRFDVKAQGGPDGWMELDFQLAPMFDSNGHVVQIVPSGVDISARTKAEHHREMLLSELSHRIKNTLATVQSIASHTLREATSMETFSEAFVGRLGAISKCHDMLVASTRDNADLSQLVREQIMPYAGTESGRVRLSGPPVVLSAESSHAIGLVLHELATNAVKYGALANATGNLSVTWARDLATGTGDIVLRWQERGGPLVSPPARRGFGSTLIEQSLKHTLAAEAWIDYQPEGLVATFRIPGNKR